jgi:hypothetical protein
MNFDCDFLNLLQDVCYDFIQNFHVLVISEVRKQVLIAITMLCKNNTDRINLSFGEMARMVNKNFLRRFVGKRYDSLHGPCNFLILEKFKGCEVYVD